MIGCAHHLQDESLFRAYHAALCGTVVESSAAAHLAACDACAKRLHELAAFMGNLRAEGEADLDATFTPERLRLQQRQIADRLEHLGQVGRVLSFPARQIGRRMVRSASRIAPRWAIAAAAAGLLVGVGVGVGTIMDPMRHHASSAVATAPSVPTREPVFTDLLAEADGLKATDDETFLSELEMALGGPRSEQLLPFDALTPRVRPTNIFLIELERALSGPRNEELLSLDALTPGAQPVNSQTR